MSPSGPKSEVTRRPRFGRDRVKSGHNADLAEVKRLTHNGHSEALTGFFRLAQIKLAGIWAQRCWRRLCSGRDCTSVSYGRWRSRRKPASTAACHL
jgi:hypothetical protein